MNTKHFAAAAFASCTLSLALAAPYTVSPDGQSVRDEGNNLQWARCAVGMRLVNGYCAGATSCQMIGNILYHSPHLKNPDPKNWRLPTAWELNTLLDESRPGPKINPSLFPGTPNTKFATNTDYNGQEKWGISFATGKAEKAGIANHCVRMVLGPIQEGTGWKWVPRRTGGF